MIKQDAEKITGKDGIEAYILLCMKDAPFEFEEVPEGAGFDDTCLAYTVPACAPGEREKGDGKLG